MPYTNKKKLKSKKNTTNTTKAMEVILPKGLRTAQQILNKERLIIKLLNAIPYVDMRDAIINPSEYKEYSQLMQNGFSDDASNSYEESSVEDAFQNLQRVRNKGGKFQSKPPKKRISIVILSSDDDSEDNVRNTRRSSTSRNRNNQVPKSPSIRTSLRTPQKNKKYMPSPVSTDKNKKSGSKRYRKNDNQIQQVSARRSSRSTERFNKNEQKSQLRKRIVTVQVSSDSENEDETQDTPISSSANKKNKKQAPVQKKSARTSSESSKKTGKKNATVEDSGTSENEDEIQESDQTEEDDPINSSSKKKNKKQAPVQKKSVRTSMESSNKTGKKNETVEDSGTSENEEENQESDQTEDAASIGSSAHKKIKKQASVQKKSLRTSTKQTSENEDETQESDQAEEEDAHLSPSASSEKEKSDETGKKTASVVEDEASESDENIQEKEDSNDDRSTRKKKTDKHAQKHSPKSLKKTTKQKKAAGTKDTAVVALSSESEEESSRRSSRIENTRQMRRTSKRKPIKTKPFVPKEKPKRFRKKNKMQTSDYRRPRRGDKDSDSDEVESDYEKEIERKKKSRKDKQSAAIDNEDETEEITLIIEDDQDQGKVSQESVVLQISKKKKSTKALDSSDEDNAEESAKETHHSSNEEEEVATPNTNVDKEIEVEIESIGALEISEDEEKSEEAASNLQETDTVSDNVEDHEKEQEIEENTVEADEVEENTVEADEVDENSVEADEVEEEKENDEENPITSLDSNKDVDSQEVSQNTEVLSDSEETVKLSQNSDTIVLDENVVEIPDEESEEIPSQTQDEAIVNINLNSDDEVEEEETADDVVENNDSVHSKKRRRFSSSDDDANEESTDQRQSKLKKQKLNFGEGSTKEQENHEESSENQGEKNDSKEGEEDSEAYYVDLDTDEDEPVIPSLTDKQLRDILEQDDKADGKEKIEGKTSPNTSHITETRQELLEASKRCTAEARTLIRHMAGESSSQSAAGEISNNTKETKTSENKKRKEEKGKENCNTNTPSADVKKKTKTPVKIRFTKGFIFSKYNCDTCNKVFSKNVDLQQHCLHHFDNRNVSVKVFRACLPTSFDTSKYDEGRYLQPRKKRSSFNTFNIDDAKSVVGKYLDNEDMMKSFDTKIDGDFSDQPENDASSEEGKLSEDVLTLDKGTVGSEINILSDISISGPVVDPEIDETELDKFIQNEPTVPEASEEICILAEELLDVVPDSQEDIVPEIQDICENESNKSLSPILTIKLGKRTLSIEEEVITKMPKVDLSEEIQEKQKEISSESDILNRSDVTDDFVSCVDPLSPRTTLTEPLITDENNIDNVEGCEEVDFGIPKTIAPMSPGKCSDISEIETAEHALKMSKLDEQLESLVKNKDKPLGDDGADADTTLIYADLSIDDQCLDDGNVSDFSELL